MKNDLKKQLHKKKRIIMSAISVIAPIIAIGAIGLTLYEKSIFGTVTKNVNITNNDNDVKKNVVNPEPQLPQFNIANGSWIRDGMRGTIFETKSGDIYLMGYGAKLQVKLAGQDQFQDVPNTITDGGEGTIFEAKNGDLYVTAPNQGLYFKSNTTKIWQRLGQGEFIDGKDASFLEDNDQNVLIMSHSAPIFVHHHHDATFKAISPNLVPNSSSGKMVVDDNGDIYALLPQTKLLVLKKGTDHFAPVAEVNLTNGINGLLFKAQNGDIYVMGKREVNVSNINNNAGFTKAEVASRLQVKRKHAPTFVDVASSNITSGFNARMFQAKNGSIYLMGSTATAVGLEVLHPNGNGFLPLPSAEINNGAKGNIFETSSGDIYVTAPGASLKVLKANATQFTNLPGNKITNGAYAMIFEADNGDIYTMANQTELQILKNDTQKWVTAPGKPLIKGGPGSSIVQSINHDIYVLVPTRGLLVLKAGTF